jgi:hypothetical protein
MTRKLAEFWRGTLHVWELGRVHAEGARREPRA